MSRGEPDRRAEREVRTVRGETRETRTVDRKVGEVGVRRHGRPGSRGVGSASIMVEWGV